MVLFKEFLGAMGAALEHPEMIAGLAKRGLAPGDVFCLPLTAGYYPTPEFRGTRLMKVPCYRNPSGSNYYAKPIEGLFAVVDLVRNKALRVVDQGVVPLPEDDWGYTQDEVAARLALRPASNPVQPTRPGRANYTIDGSRIEWDIWRFRLRIDKRPGAALSNIEVRDGRRWRSVLYQVHLSEVFVPYMDIQENKTVPWSCFRLGVGAGSAPPRGACPPSRRAWVVRRRSVFPCGSRPRAR